ncbi:MAG: HU family DNA-binding protein [Verrucomicrobiota bacterium]
MAATPKKELTKTEIVASLADSTGFSKTDVNAILGELSGLIEKSIGRRGPGSFTLPGLLKIEKKKKPATKKRMGVNPRTGEPMEIAAKPARNDVKVRALKGLKDMV